MFSAEPQINVKASLDSGQIFRYEPTQQGYRIHHGQGSFTVSNDFQVQGISQSKASSFFRLDDDYTQILQSIDKDQTIHGAIHQYQGLRLLRQDPWECTVSFLCSSATNIPRIKRDLNNIARTFGEQKDGFHTFPKIGEIDNLQKIRQCGTGFRAKYIYEVNSSVAQSFFTKLKRLKYEDAKNALMELPGIGPKIADCILLFSLDHLSAFPIDTWMEKVLTQDYNKRKKNYNHLSQFARSYFGQNAGYAQQFLYHWKRHEQFP
jgi:N-glycosylase/DNA lyase